MALQLNGYDHNGHEIFVETRHKRDIKKQQKQKQAPKNSLILQNVRPLTENQERVFDAWNMGKNLLLSGYAGTGKTFLCTYLALQYLNKHYPLTEKVYIIRSAVPSRDVGFLKGRTSRKVKSI